MDVNAIFQFATEHGLFPVLFVFAFWYIISESKAREKSQRELFEKLSEDVEKISDSFETLEETVKRIDGNVANSSQPINGIQTEVTQLKYMISTLETIIKSYIR